MDADARIPDRRRLAELLVTAGAALAAPDTRVLPTPDGRRVTHGRVSLGASHHAQLGVDAPDLVVATIPGEFAWVGSRALMPRFRAVVEVERVSVDDRRRLMIPDDARDVLMLPQPNAFSVVLCTAPDVPGLFVVPTHDFVRRWKSVSAHVVA